VQLEFSVHSHLFIDRCSVDKGVSLSNLKSLNLSRNSVSIDEPEAEFPVSLTSLNLSENRISTIPKSIQKVCIEELRGNDSNQATKESNALLVAAE